MNLECIITKRTFNKVRVWTKETSAYICPVFSPKQHSMMTLEIWEVSCPPWVLGTALWWGCPTLRSSADGKGTEKNNTVITVWKHPIHWTIQTQTQIHTHTCLHECIHQCMHTHPHACTHTHTPACTHTHKHTHPILWCQLKILPKCCHWKIPARRNKTSVYTSLLTLVPLPLLPIKYCSCLPWEKPAVTDSHKWGC